MKLDVALIRQQLVHEPVRDRIADDYGIQDPSDEPAQFAQQIIDQFEQPVVEDALAHHRSSSDVFRAAVLSIASSNARWSAFLKEKESLAALLGGYDPAYTSARLETGEITVDAVARHLKSPYKAKDAERIRDWAELLTATPDYYELIQDAGAALRQVSTTELPDEKLLLCLVGYFTAPTARWPGESHLKSALKDINPVAGRKFPGMGRPLASEFLRNLGWNGYKPDRHIVRLFREWTGGDLPDRFDDEARRLCALIGRRDKDLRADVHSALLRIALTPEDVSYLEADNLIWLLGAYVETLASKAPRPRYIID